MHIGLLHHILGVCIVVHYPADDAIQALVATLHDVPERTSIATLDQCDERAILHYGVIGCGVVENRVHDVQLVSFT